MNCSIPILDHLKLERDKKQKSRQHNRSSAVFRDQSQQKGLMVYYLNKHTPGTVHSLIKETVKDAIKGF